MNPVLDTTQLETDIAAIQVLHARLGQDLAKSMAYHTGNFMYIKRLNDKNVLTSVYIDILYKYYPVNNEEISNAYNVLTMTEVQSIIDDCYRQLERYNTI